MNNFRKQFIMLAIVLAVSIAGSRAFAMKPLSNEDLGGVTGKAGVSLYFKDIDATLLQVDEFQLDLTPDTTWDSKFRITDDSNAVYLNLGNDDDSGGAHSMAFCGSFTDENTPIDVDWLGFDIDIGHEETAGNGLEAGAVVVSMTGYGSTALFWNWDLVQFIAPATGALPLTTRDVFGLRLGELFWAEKYIDPNKHKFMYSIMSPLSSFQDSAFIDSNEGPWHSSASKEDIRSYTGIGGELGLRPGGGTLGFFGLTNPDTLLPQEATANNVMFAGEIIDKGDSSNFANQHPNYQTFNATYYYSDDIEDWNIMGEFVQGVHHQRTYTRTNYIGQYANGSAFDMSAHAQRQIGQTSPTRPIRIEVATSSNDCDGDGINDTYLIAYLNGHYARTVYYPDSAVSSMGASIGGAVPTTPAWKNYIIGEIRIGRFREADPDRDGDGNPDIVNATYPAGCDHTGGWAINDISVPYTKIVIPGNRSLVQEISASSEAYIIPNADYGDNGAVGSVARMSFAGNLDPASKNRTMNIASPFNGAYGSPQAYFGSDRNIPASFWR